VSRRGQHRGIRPGTANPERLPDIREFGANLPVDDELRAGLLEIAVGAACVRDGETRAVELESLVGYELEPPPSLLQRLRKIPAHGPAGRPAAFVARPGTATALAASYLLAAALTLVLGDPVAAGRRAATSLGAAAGEHLLEPAADAGASVHARVGRRLGSLQGLWHPSGIFTDPLDLPTNRVRDWFRSAVDSSSEAARGLGGLWPRDPSGDGDQQPPSTGNQPQTSHPQTKGERSSA
jgi:hypothetical protein